VNQPLGDVVANWHAPPRPGKTALAGRYCRMEPLDLERHAAELFAANALDKTGANWTYLAYGPFATLPEYRAWLERTCRGDDPLFYVIIDNARNQAAGVASYLRIDPANGAIEVGHLNYSPLLQRTPAATEAMYLLMQQVFALGYRRYEWKCDALNAPSRAAAQRLGFSFEGIFRQAAIVKGRNRDTAWYAIIDKDWPTLDAAYQQWLDPANFDAAGMQIMRLAELTGSMLHKWG